MAAFPVRSGREHIKVRQREGIAGGEGARREVWASET